MPQSAARPPRHLLLVDDDAVALSFLAEGLAAAGYHVAAARSGEEALEYAANRRFGLAIVDMRMPVQSGAEVAKSLLSSHGCFSLILSGHSDPETVRAAAEDGALGYLVKPVDIASLVPAIETALARSEEMSRLARSHEHLHIALREGRETSMAIGILVERLHLDRESAFARIRDQARNERKKVVQVAQEILAAAEALNRFGSTGG